MIQRIQTVYLLAGGALLAAFVGVLSQAPSAADPTLRFVGLALLVAAGLAAVLSFGAVALYKNRALQRRVVSAVLWATLVVIAGTLAVLLLRMQAGEPVAQSTMLTAAAPVVAYLMLRLARAGVDRDIATIRSMDRIR